MVYSFDLDCMLGDLVGVFLWFRWRFGWQIHLAFGMIFDHQHCDVFVFVYSLDKPFSKQPLSISLWKRVRRLEKKVCHRWLWGLWQLSGIRKHWTCFQFRKLMVTIWESLAFKCSSQEKIVQHNPSSFKTTSLHFYLREKWDDPLDKVSPFTFTKV